MLNEDGVSPLALAAENGNVVLMQVLMDHGAALIAEDAEEKDGVENILHSFAQFADNRKFLNFMTGQWGFTKEKTVCVAVSTLLRNNKFIFSFAVPVLIVYSLFMLLSFLLPATPLLSHRLLRRSEKRQSHF